MTTASPGGARTDRESAAPPIPDLPGQVPSWRTSEVRDARSGRVTRQDPRYADTSDVARRRSRSSAAREVPGTDRQ